MDPEFWHQRWQRREIGFHRDRPHPALERHWATLAVAPPRRVFVPLCGKSPDLAWLWRRGHAVVGVELSPLAVREFFDEQALATEREALAGGLRRWRATGTAPGTPPLEIIEGDLFALTPQVLGAVDAVYDRASLIAFPPARRRDYARTLCVLARVPTLLVTVEYPRGEMDGPPFAVGDDEVRALYGGDFALRCLEATDRIDEEERFRRRGVTRFVERVHALTPRGGER